MNLGSLNGLAALIVWLIPNTTGSSAVYESSAVFALTGEIVKDTVWYDAESGNLRPVEVQPQRDDSIHRASRWLPRPQKVKQPKAESAGGSGLLGTGYTIGYLLGWVLIVALVLVTVVFISFLIHRYQSTASMVAATGWTSGRDRPDQPTAERINQLPAELRRSDVNLRDEARRLMSAEEYDQAIILLFGHQLLLLDRAGAVRLARGKTNRQYVGESDAFDSRLSQALSRTARAFEHSYFGRHAITAAQFAELWRANADLEQNVARRTEVAA